MGHDHHHHGHVGVQGENRRVLFVSLLIIGGYMVVEFIGGLMTNSLALLSDAGHMFSDGLALGLSLVAFYLSEKPASRQRTYGNRRFEIVAAAINGLALVVIAVLIVYEAIGRFIHPPEIATGGMLVISVIGLLTNILVAWYMHRFSETEHNINMRGAYLHVLGDLLGSVGAIVAAVCMMLFGWRWADPLASLAVAVLIGYSAVGILKTTLHVLMEGTPDSVELDELSQAMLAVPGVEALHDLHVWTITSNMNALSCHVVVNEALTVREVGELICLLEQKLYALQVHHVTIQVEGSGHGHGNQLLCRLSDGYDLCSGQH